MRKTQKTCSLFDVTQNDEHIFYSFHDATGLDIQDVLDEILFHVKMTNPKKIILDLRKISNISKKIQFFDFYLYFIQFLPLFNVKKLKIILDSTYQVNHLNKQIQFKINKDQRIEISILPRNNT
jgi:hypothetical protein